MLMCVALFSVVAARQLVSVPDLVARYGYPVETHGVTTSDGYQLVLHRIPRSGVKRKVVLLQHGVMGSSADWLLLGPNSSLGFLLADSGYDVWMTNDRGNSYSRKHDSLNTIDKKYWDFTFHEVGTRDLPAAVDHVLETTGETQLLLVAHSTGGTSALVMCASLPAACDKVRGLVAMAPVVSTRPATRALLAPLGRVLASFKTSSRKSRVYEVPKGSCRASRTPQSQLMCSNFMLAVTGYRPRHIDPNVAAAFLSHLPPGASIKAVEHIWQNLQAGRFQQFDLGAGGNLRQYGARVPPGYNLSAISTRVATLHSAGDLLSPLKDSGKLFASFPNAKKKIDVGNTTFKHFDYILSKKAKTLVYESVVSLLNDFDSLFDFTSDIGVVVISFAPQEDDAN